MLLEHVVTILLLEIYINQKISMAQHTLFMSIKMGMEELVVLILSA